MKRTALVDLHLHLDGSLDLPWAYEESKKVGLIDENCSFEDYYRIVYQTKYKNREDGFRKFALMCGVLQTRENLFTAAYNLVRRLSEKGMIYAEIRFASQQHMDKGLTQKEAVQAVIDGARKGMEDFPDIKVGIINCLMHKGENAAFNCCLVKAWLALTWPDMRTMAISEITVRYSGWLRNLESLIRFMPGKWALANMCFMLWTCSRTVSDMALTACRMKEFSMRS